MLLKKILTICIVLLLSAVTSADDEQNEAPEREVHGDWFTLCAKSVGICTMNQVQYVETEQGRSQVLHAHISKNRQNELLMQLILPLGVVLPPGVVMKIDQGDEFIVPYHTCTAQGCVAVVPLVEGRLGAMRKGNEALVGFRPVGTEKTAVIKVSLKGFTKASRVIQNSSVVE